MITYEEAARIIDRHAEALDSEELDLGLAHGRLLAAPVAARYDSPPFDNSAVDGYGRRGDDLDAGSFECVGEIAAGQAKDSKLLRGQCVRIFTGSRVPRDVEAISMQEDCEAEGEQVTFKEKSSAGDHIRLAGGDFRAGEVILSAGAWLGPAQIAAAASGGVRKVQVTGVPRVGILTTGTELLDLSNELSPGKIYDSNSFGLTSAVSLATCKSEYARASDNPDVMRERLNELLGCHVIITSGGVSVGDHDLVRESLTDLGVEQRFWRVAIKPGKPVFFGTRGRQLFFGLPGNPVSALVTYLMFVAPALRKMRGHPDPWPMPQTAELRTPVSKKAGRMEFLRGNLSQDGGKMIVHSLEGQGSHQLAALAAANCLIHFPLEATSLSPGELVGITPVDWRQ